VIAHQTPPKARRPRTRLRRSTLLLALALTLGAVAWWSRAAVRAVEPATYVALGASDAVGVGADDPASQGWVPQLYRTLPDSAHLLNLGISGATLADVLRAELPPALDARPRWITLWPGINDLRQGVTLAAFSGNLEQLLHRVDVAQLDPPPLVVLLTIPDLRHLHAFRDIAPPELDATVRRWNAAITAAAGRHGARVVDLYAHGPDLAAHPDYISADGFHPSSSGYRRIAEIAAPALRSGAAGAP
jgi:lysophospholipase L1-like esterase